MGPLTKVMNGLWVGMQWSDGMEGWREGGVSIDHGLMTFIIIIVITIISSSSLS